MNRIPSFKTHLYATVKRQKDIINLSLYDQWRYLLHIPLTNLEKGLHQTRFLVVIDALDECEGDNDIRTVLRLLSDASTITTIQLRFFITSRPETSIRLGFRKMSSILHHDLILDEVSRELTDRDIFSFFEQRFSEIADEFEDVTPDWPGQERIAALVERSDGLFIYAATICRFIKDNDRWSPDDLLAIFLPRDAVETSGKRQRKPKLPRISPFSELDSIYSQILEQSLRGIKHEEDRIEIANETREIICTIGILYQPQSLRTLSQILGMELITVQQRLKHLRSVLVVPEDGNTPIRILHPSFRDFLLDDKRCTNPLFFTEESVMNGSLADKCADILFKSLKQDVCDVKQPGISTSDVEEFRIQQALPLEVQYACVYWIQHVLGSGRELSDDHWTYDLFSRYFLQWLESLSWLRRLSDGIHALIALESRISVGLICGGIGRAH